jgi:hypothetical protein
MPDRHIVDASLTGPSPRLTGVMDIVITPMWGWTCRTACRLDELPSRRPLVAPTNGHNRHMIISSQRSHSALTADAHPAMRRYEPA